MGTLISLLATVVLISTVCTLIFAVFAYIASRRPKRRKATAEEPASAPTQAPLILPVQLLDPQFQASLQQSYSQPFAPEPKPAAAPDPFAEMDRTIVPEAPPEPSRQSDPGVPLYHAFKPEEELTLR